MRRLLESGVYTGGPCLKGNYGKRQPERAGLNFECHFSSCGGLSTALCSKAVNNRITVSIQFWITSKKDSITKEKFRTRDEAEYYHYDLSALFQTYVICDD